MKPGDREWFQMVGRAIDHELTIRGATLSNACLADLWYECEYQGWQQADLVAFIERALPQPIPTPTPEHRGWPADRALWTRFRFDFIGFRLPSLLRFGKTATISSWIYPLYPDDVRAEIRAIWTQAKMSHVVLDPRPKYGVGWYPKGVLTPAQFKATLYEMTDHDPQFLPIVFWLDDSAGTTEADWERTVGPYLADPEIVSLCMVNAVAWEMNSWLKPATRGDAAIRWLRKRLHPDALLYVHFTPEHGANTDEPGDSANQQWWSRMARENLLDGVFGQEKIDNSLEKVKSGLVDISKKFTQGHKGYPTHRTDGRPMHFALFEYDGYFQTRNQVDVHAGDAYGDMALTIPGCDGYGDGGTKR